MLTNRSRWIAWFILATGCSFAQAQRDEGDLSLPERARVATKIYSMLDSCFAHRQGIPDLDLDAAYNSYLAKAFAAAGRLEFDLATLEFVALLRNKHTQFNDQWLNLEHGQPLGFGALPVEGKWVITWAWHPELRKGDVIRSIEGIPVSIFTNNITKYISSSSMRARLNLAFDRAYLFPQRFRLQLEDGREVRVDRSDAGRVPSRGGDPAVEGRWLSDDKIFYIKVRSFSDSRYEGTALELVKSHYDARGLIIDVRGNGGGKTPYGLIGQLMDREWLTWTTSTPSQVALYRARGNPRTQLQLEGEKFRPRPDAYKGRLAILVDRFTCSASEDFVMPFKQNGRAVIVGETTEGSFGQPHFQDFGNGMSFMAGAARHTFPDGSQFESIGILPTIPIEMRIDDLRNGIDAVLAKARETIATP
jgi:carboxyl-terminal processing protease